MMIFTNLYIIKNKVDAVANAKCSDLLRGTLFSERNLPCIGASREKGSGGNYATYSKYTLGLIL
jgi:hypothetical protein